MHYVAGHDRTARSDRWYCFRVVLRVCDSKEDRPQSVPATLKGIAGMAPPKKGVAAYYYYYYYYYSTVQYSVVQYSTVSTVQYSTVIQIDSFCQPVTGCMAGMTYDKWCVLVPNQDK